MPTTRKSKTSTGPKSASKGTRRKASRQGKESGKILGRASLKKKAKAIGTKVLAGAVAGAVKAMIPPLEEAAGNSERAAGIKPRGRSRARRSR